MKATRISIYSWAVAGIVILLVALAGCGSDGSSVTPDTSKSDGDTPAPAPDNSSNARSDAILRALADDAATSSGIVSFTVLTNTTADEVGGAGSDGTSSGGQDPTGGFLSIDANAVPAAIAATALGNAISSIGKAGGILERLGINPNAATTSQTVSGTFSCLSGGTVTISGTLTVTVPDDPNATSGTITVSIINLDISFNACDEGIYTLWGQIRYNTDDSIVFNFAADGSSGSFTITFDEYLDAGMVVRRNSDSMVWNFTLRETLLGSLAISFNASTFTTDSVNLTATSTLVDNVTGATFSCTATATSEAELINPTVTCTTS